MWKPILLTLMALFAVESFLTNEAQAEARYLRPLRRAQTYNWHYGRPTALVVPPTAQLQTNWSWGAPSSRVSRIDHQFTRDYSGPGPFGGGNLRHTPHWPQDLGIPRNGRMFDVRCLIVDVKLLMSDQQSNIKHLTSLQTVDRARA